VDTRCEGPKLRPVGVNGDYSGLICIFMLVSDQLMHCSDTYYLRRSMFSGLYRGTCFYQSYVKDSPATFSLAHYS